KPPLTYWLIGACDVLVGTNELAARLPSAVAAVAIVLLLVWLGAILYDLETGLLAGFVLLAMGGFFVETHEVRPDLPLTASIVGSLLALAVLLREETQTKSPSPSASPSPSPSLDLSSRQRIRAGAGARARAGVLIALQISLAIGLLAKGMLAVLIPG